MKHLYLINPVDFQPQWPSKPQQVHHQWGRGFLAVGFLAITFIVVVDVLQTAYLLGGGS